MNDYAGLLGEAERSGLEARLVERERATGAQMAIAIFQALEGEQLEDFSIRLAQRWRIGRKGLDNGVVLVVFVADRRMRLEVGYGLEAAVPDAEAGRIIRDVIGPRFRERQYARGLEDAVDAVFARVPGPQSDGQPGERQAPTSRPPQGTTQPTTHGAVLIPLLVIALLVSAVLVVGFVVGWIFHNAPSRHGYTVEPYGRSRRRARRAWGVPVIWPGGSGGWSGGSSSGGGSSGGGGFSGGGGGFGGGGASGSW